tara:strand:- start:210 stop:584 length:375 start_codon:yes stop_codon:yes gene_type:complete
MIKEKYGIEITKPWSSEMYDWNDKVLEDLKKKITKLWKQGYASALEDYKELDQDMKFEDSDWSIHSNGIMEEVQKSITFSGYGSGFTIYDIEKEVFQELEVAPYWHVKQMAEELYIEEMFIGLK